MVSTPKSFNKETISSLVVPYKFPCVIILSPALTFAIIEAAMAAKADIVVLCSSDDEYAEYAVPAFKALNGRAMFIVAGAPACMDDLKAAGIENFIHVRVNVLETLKEFNAKLLK